MRKSRGLPSLACHHWSASETTTGEKNLESSLQALQMIDIQDSPNLGNCRFFDMTTGKVKEVFNLTHEHTRVRYQDKRVLNNLEKTSDEEITRLNAMFKGMVVDNFGPTRFRDEA
nr:hypothetical protein CFP56_47742 [Quercus suber]